MNRGVFMQKLTLKQPSGTFVQTDRKAHEEWAKLTLKKPAAAALMHILSSQVGENNAVVASYGTLAELVGVSQMTIRRAVETLRDGKWIEVRQIGGAGSTNAYIINDRVAWFKSRDGMRYSLFSASVIVSEKEQPDRKTLEQQEPIRRLPRIGELQMPFGEGLPPPSQPSLPNMEHELPSVGSDYPKRTPK